MEWSPDFQQVKLVLLMGAAAQIPCRRTAASVPVTVSKHRTGQNIRDTLVWEMVSRSGGLRDRTSQKKVRFKRRLAACVLFGNQRKEKRLASFIFSHIIRKIFFFKPTCLFL